MNIGFDIWGTLIKSSPYFRQAKFILFEEMFPEYDYKVVNKAVEETKVAFNVIIDKTGISPTREMLFNYMYNTLTSKVNQDDNLVKIFFEKYDNLFKIFQPQVIDHKTTELLKDLMEKGHTNYFISNTLFTGGRVLNEVLKDMGFASCFKLGYYSDVRGYSKPYNKIVDINLDIVVGDNPKTDGVFAKSMNAEFIQINTNDKTIEDAYKQIISSKD